MPRGGTADPEGGGRGQRGGPDSGGRDGGGGDRSGRAGGVGTSDVGGGFSSRDAGTGGTGRAGGVGGEGVGGGFSAQDARDSVAGREAGLGIENEAGFNFKDMLKAGALLTVAPQMAPVVGMALMAKAALGPIGTQLSEGEPAEFSGPEQRGAKENQRDRPTEQVAGPLRDPNKSNDDADTTLTSQFETPLFDQILDNLLNGESPLSAIDLGPTLTGELPDGTV